MSRLAAAADEEDSTVLVFDDDMSPESIEKIIDTLKLEHARNVLKAKRLQTRQMAVRLLKTDAKQSADRLELLRQLSKALPPAHDQPAGLLQQDTASAVAAAMRAVDPEALGAADAVPLVVALMQYEWAIADKEEIGVILGACYPHVAATLQWTRSAHAQTLQSGRPPRPNHLRALRAVARLCGMAAAHLARSREERRKQAGVEPVQRMPPAEAVAFDAACLAAQTAATARRLLRAQPGGPDPEQVLSAGAAATRANTALQATGFALHALRHARKAAKRFPPGAARPAAAAFSSLFAVIEVAQQAGTAYTVLSESASLLTEVPGGLPRRHALQLEANVMDAAAAALGQAEAAGHLGSDGPNALQQQYMMLAAALPRVVATAETLAALSRGIPPTPERSRLLAFLLRWAVYAQLHQQMLLQQQPAMVFRERHPDGHGTRGELLWDQVLSVADAAAHGIAAGLLMAIGAALSSRQHAVAAAGSSSGEATLQPWTVDAQLAAAGPALDVLVNALFKGVWGIWPPDGAWAAADALVTLAGFVADALADAAGTAAARNAAATAGAKQTPAAAGSDVSPGTAAAGRSAAGDNTHLSATEAACSTDAHLDRQIDTAATQLVSPDLLRHAADGALMTAHWANRLVAAVQHSMPADGKGTDRREKLEAELRAARLAAAAAGTMADIAATTAGGTALLNRRDNVVPNVLTPLVWGLTVKGMHQGSAAAAELAALMRNVAAMLPEFLVPPDGNADAVLRWHEEAAKAQKQPRGSLSAELLRAVSAVSDALRGACGSSGSGGTAVAAQQEAEAAANAAFAALVQEEEAKVAAASPSRSKRKGKAKKG